MRRRIGMWSQWSAPFPTRTALVGIALRSSSGYLRARCCVSNSAGPGATPPLRTGAVVWITLLPNPLLNWRSIRQGSLRILTTMGTTGIRGESDDEGRGTGERGTGERGAGERGTGEGVPRRFHDSSAGSGPG